MGFGKWNQFTTRNNINQHFPVTVATIVHLCKKCAIMNCGPISYFYLFDYFSYYYECVVLFDQKKKQLYTMLLYIYMSRFIHKVMDQIRTISTYTFSMIHFAIIIILYYIYILWIILTFPFSIIQSYICDVFFSWKETYCVMIAGLMDVFLLPRKFFPCLFEPG